MKLQTFSFDDNEVRTVVQNGELWFVANDVTKILGLDRTQVRRLDEDEKGVRIIHTPGGRQEVNVINEFGLYSLILSSRKPEAKQFKRWVTHEVLPSIRKTGRYALPSADEIASSHPARLMIEGRTWGKKFSEVEKMRETNMVFISAEEVARRCGIYTTAKYMAKPHGKFIHNLIHAQLIEIDEEEVIFNPTCYLESVVPKVLDWLERRNYPNEITFGNTVHRIQIFQPEGM